MIVRSLHISKRCSVQVVFSSETSLSIRGVYEFELAVVNMMRSDLYPFVSIVLSVSVQMFAVVTQQLQAPSINDNERSNKQDVPRELRRIIMGKSVWVLEWYRGAV